MSNPQMERHFLVYKITCIANGLAYIGATGRSIARRWHEHRRSAQSGSATPLHIAIREHGAESFVIAIVASCATLKESRVAEVTMIAEHRTRTPNGFNVDKGGNAPSPGWKQSASVVAQISARVKTLTNTPEWKERTAAMGRSTRGSKRTPEQLAVLHAVVDTPEHRSEQSAVHGVGAVSYGGETYASLAELARMHRRSKTWATQLFRAGAIEAIRTVPITPRRAEIVARRSMPVILNGVTYPSIAACKRMAGIHQRTLYRMLADGRAQYAERSA